LATAGLGGLALLGGGGWWMHSRRRRPAVDPYGPTAS
jgi:LPXTG-motif cell wall-anchored protein